MTYNPETIRVAYDELAEKEDEFQRGHSLRNEIPREFIKRHLRASDVVLDTGGGSGINAMEMVSSAGKNMYCEDDEKWEKLKTLELGVSPGW